MNFSFALFESKAQIAFRKSATDLYNEGIHRGDQTQ